MADIHRRPNRILYYGLLWCACLLGLALTSIVLMRHGLTHVWANDSVPQDINFFIYTGEWIRAFLAGLVTGEFTAPMFTYNLGYGTDVFWSVMGFWNDPFNLLSVIWPPQHAEIAYELLLYARIGLCATFFVWYAKSKGHGPWACFVGALVYAFSGYVIFQAIMHHASFVNVALVFPLVLLGADRLFEGKSPIMYILALAFSLYTTFYFTYMVALALIVYCIAKYVFEREQKSLSDLAKLVAQFIGYALLGLCIAGVSVLPGLSVVLSMSRVGLERSIPLLYDGGRYWSFATDLIGGSSYVGGLCIGAVGAFCLIVFLVGRKRIDRNTWRIVLVALIVSLVIVCVPKLGSVTNGFAYVSDRWLFVFDFVAAYATVCAVPVVKGLSKQEWGRVCLVSGILLVLSGSYGFVYESRWALIMCVGFVLVVAASVALATRIPDGAYAFCLAAAVLVGAGATGCLYTVAWGGNHLGEFNSSGVSVPQLDDAAVGKASDLESQGLWRLSPVDRKGPRNASLYHDVMAIDFFGSYYNQNVDTFRSALGVADKDSCYIFAGNDGRTALEYLTGSKYVIVADGTDWRVPYGYEDTGIDAAEGYSFYVTTHAAPLAFMYDNSLSLEAFNQLNLAQRQEAMLSACVLEGGDVQDGRSMDLTSEALPYRIEDADGIEFRDGMIYASKDKASFDLVLPEGTQVPAGSFETEVCFTGLQYAPDPQDMAERLAVDEPLKNKIKRLCSNQNNEYTEIYVYTDDRETYLCLYDNFNKQYSGRENWAFNLGTSEEAPETITVWLSKKGFYTYDTLDVLAQPGEPLAEKAQALQAVAASRLELGENRIDARFEVSDEAVHYAFVSVPYSKGWSAIVDGKPAEILQANVGFMALRLQGEGVHDVQLTYRTPLLLEGLACTIAGIAVTVVIGILFARKRARSAYDEQRTKLAGLSE
ncbi:Predicted membrane protein [Slackia heliotrinireducens]|uniref:Bacterial membrane protein YfhO n=1 Tax=Slackia heliotrinireducens (strain ATCC 29202 / DSM 20476 / NCTC 11029 / RHS 1) TaxID=471855 RepID=C7N6C3_SLAHD|nr:YfhO family protein [Slackia heliotrinireducens]ACV22458.1 Bacterial membrane protein YfhO [Slackia heliotrinireducens DSM 20476]VEH00829.1 Predicted membrane protein [Slackia heliotrinireducens]